MVDNDGIPTSNASDTPSPANHVASETDGKGLNGPALPKNKMVTILHALLWCFLAVVCAPICLFVATALWYIFVDDSALRTPGATVSAREQRAARSREIEQAQRENSNPNDQTKNSPNEDE